MKHANYEVWELVGKCTAYSSHLRDCGCAGWDPLASVPASPAAGELSAVAEHVVFVRASSISRYASYMSIYVYMCTYTCMYMY